MPNQDNNIEDVKVIDESTDEVIPYRYAITSYGADYPVDSLISRLEKEVVFVPHFQRSYVWSITQASRFIESLLLGLPVPGIFLSRDPTTAKLLIIDGHQRLKTLQYFYDGIFHNGNAFTLRNVQDRLEGKTYKTLDEHDRITLDDSIIHATVVKQEEPSDDQSSIYHIFERLNTGGTLLQPQEIRACIYHGEFNEYLNILNEYEPWRNVYGPKSKRLKDQELILRFFSLYYNIDNYKKPFKEFMNDFMAKNRNHNLYDKDTLGSSFKSTINKINESIGNSAFRPEGTLNAAVYDAVMVGLCRRLERNEIESTENIIDIYDELLTNTEFIDACKRSTSNEVNVKKRIDIATNYFSELS